MSRTNKDRPHWVKTNDPLENRYEHHDHRPRVVRCITGEREVTETRGGYFGTSTYTRTRIERTFYSGSIPVECDLEPATINWRWKPKGQRFRQRCTYEVYGPNYKRYWSGHAPKWYIDCVYHNPMRRDARDVLREAVKEYNATGETDLEPTVLADSGVWWD